MSMIFCAFVWLRNILPRLSSSSVYKVMATLNKSDLSARHVLLREYKKDSDDLIGPGASKTEGEKKWSSTVFKQTLGPLRLDWKSMFGWPDLHD